MAVGLLMGVLSFIYRRFVCKDVLTITGILVVQILVSAFLAGETSKSFIWGLVVWGGLELVVFSRDWFLRQRRKAQLVRQREGHRHGDYEVDLEIGPDLILENFIVLKSMLRPEVMTSIHFARWLHANPDLYRDKVIVDMGCGTGLLGIVMTLSGFSSPAISLTKFVDSDWFAVKNASLNIERFLYSPLVSVVQSDLFRNFNWKHRPEVVVFNHPFFDGVDVGLSSRSTVGGESLLVRFFAQAREIIEPDGLVIMPYYHLAGKANDPGVQGPEHGFEVVRRETVRIREGLQRGLVSFYVLQIAPPR